MVGATEKTLETEVPAMTLHQLTQTATVEFDLRLAETVRRVAAKVQGFMAARRLERELAMLDHREIADLAFRR